MTKARVIQVGIRLMQRDQVVQRRDRACRVQGARRDHHVFVVPLHNTAVPHDVGARLLESVRDDRFCSMPADLVGRRNEGHVFERPVTESVCGIGVWPKGGNGRVGRFSELHVQRKVEIHPRKGMGRHGPAQFQRIAADAAIATLGLGPLHVEQQLHRRRLRARSRSMTSRASSDRCALSIL